MANNPDHSGAVWWPVRNEEGHLCVCLLEGKCQLHHKKGHSYYSLSPNLTFWRQENEPGKLSHLLTQPWRSQYFRAWRTLMRTVALWQTRLCLSCQQEIQVWVTLSYVWLQPFPDPHRNPQESVQFLGASGTKAQPWSYRMLQIPVNLHLWS